MKGFAKAMDHAEYMQYNTCYYFSLSFKPYNIIVLHTTLSYNNLMHNSPLAS